MPSDVRLMLRLGPLAVEVSGPDEVVVPAVQQLHPLVAAERMPASTGGILNLACQVDAALAPTPSAALTQMLHDGHTRTPKFDLQGVPWPPSLRRGNIDEHSGLRTTTLDTGTVVQTSETDCQIQVALAASQPIGDLRFVIDTALSTATEGAGGTILHAASAVSPDGDVWLIVGDAGAGKTTLVLALVTRCGFRFLSSDRTACRVDLGRPVAWAIPDPVNVGVGTIRGNPFLAAHEALPHDVIGQSSHRDKLVFHPEQLSRVFPLAGSSAYPIRRVLLPSLFADETALRDVGRSFLERALRDSALSPVDPLHPRWVGALGVDDVSLATDVASVLDNLADLPGSEVRAQTPDDVLGVLQSLM